jgi:hypothetical protein
MADDDQTKLERLRIENERLSKEQWLRLLDMAEDIRGFVRDNADNLKVKD